MEGRKWIAQIAALQRPDGSWGRFHSLGKPTRQAPFTTEMAVRRLLVLGQTAQDEPLARALAYLRGVLARQIAPPDAREAVLNWDFFEQMMAATWIRLIVPADAEALAVAGQWAALASEAFASGSYDAAAYEAAYRARIPRLNSRERLIALDQFYMVNLLQGMLPAAVEAAYLAWLIDRPQGIYYVYDRRIAALPPRLWGRAASRYLGALECLAGYACAPGQLRFAVDWLHAQRGADGGWDLGPEAKDGIHLPLSDSWRTPQARAGDCTLRVSRLLARLAA